MLKTRKQWKTRVRWGRVLLAAAVLGILAVIWFHFDANAPSLLNFATETPTEPQSTVPYNPQDFVLDERGFMTCLSGEYATGIDVSEFQKQIDWDAVKSDGIEFVWIRLGGRGTTEGKLYTDSMTQTHYKGAKAAGLEVGMYFYSQAVTLEEAEEEAAFVLEHCAGYQLDLPFVYDWEWGGQGSRTTNMEKQLLTEITETFCKAISDGGLSPMIYFNESQGLEQLDLERLGTYPFWLAMYDGSMDFPYPVAYWQYSSTGTVQGIDGDVDLNIRFMA